MKTKIKQYFENFIGTQGIASFRITIGITLALLAAGVVAVSVDTLTTFTTGTTAKASEVNANFTALNKAVSGIPSWTKTTNSSGVETGAYYTGGNVLIGSTTFTNYGSPWNYSPFFQLSNSSSNNGYAAIINQKSSTSGGLILDSADDANIFFAKSGTMKWLFSSNATNGNFNIIDATTSSGRFSITSSGNVGIGTTSPTQKLHISSGEVNIDQDYAYRAGGNWLIGQSSGTNKILIGSSNIANDIQFNSSSVTAILMLKSTGNVGIGTTTPDTTCNAGAKLCVAGNVYANTTQLTSDKKYKKNIKSLDNALDKILQLKSVEYYWKVDEYKEMSFDKGKQYGFIAQDVEKVLPDLVSTSANGSKSLKYNNIIPFAVQAIKELKLENAELSSRYASLLDDHNLLKLELKTHSRASLRMEQENDLLKKRLDKLESVVAGMERGGVEKMVKR